MVRQLVPDVVLMDLVMSCLDGITATRQVKHFPFESISTRRSPGRHGAHSEHQEVQARHAPG